MTRKGSAKIGKGQSEQSGIDPLMALAESGVSHDVPADALGARDTLPPFCVGIAPDRPNAVLPALDRINQRFAKRMRVVLELIVKARLSVDLLRIDTQNYGQWQASQPDHACLTIFGMRPLEGNAMLLINQICIARLVDLYYGGTGNCNATTGIRELTPTEDRFAARLAETVINALGGVWSELIAVEPLQRSREANIAFAKPVLADEEVVICEFAISGGAIEREEITLLYSVEMLRAAHGLMIKGDSNIAPAETGEWKQSLAESASSIVFKARTVLARPEISLGRLLSMAPGDSFPFTASSHVPLIIGDRVIAMGTLGEQSGQAAFKVERLEQGKLA